MAFAENGNVPIPGRKRRQTFGLQRNGIPENVGFYQTGGLGVVGSNPAAPTININGLQNFLETFFIAVRDFCEGLLSRPQAAGQGDQPPSLQPSASLRPLLRCRRGWCRSRHDGRGSAPPSGPKSSRCG
jgi:hypothetical protein